MLILRIVLCVFNAILCQTAKEPPMVTIPNQGTLLGKEVSLIRTQRIITYLGIPYAQPPLDSLRFAPPAIEPLPNWDGVRNASEFAPACLQTKEDYRERDLPFLHLLSDLTFDTSEDCLYLNVFVPYGAPPPEGFAVMVWIHPGNFTTGDPAMWNPYSLVFKQNIIVVTVAYRLNIMGFFTTMDGEAAGNYGILDQIAALNWIKTNIKLFGGNPNSICLVGYGTGAVSVGIHMISQLSTGLFTKAVAMSNNFLSPTAVKLPQDDRVLLDALADYFACFRFPTSLLLDCLRRADANSLISFTSEIDWKPIIDQGLTNNTAPLIPELPLRIFEKGEFNKVPFMTGYTDMEDVLNNLEILHVSDDTDVPDEYLTTVLFDFVSRDLPQINNTENCIYNHDHILDSVLFFYRPQPPAKTLADVRKTLTDFITEKNYGASTFLQAHHVSKHKPTYMYRFDMKPMTDGAVAELPSWASVPHLFDLIYLWGMPYWAQLPNQQEWDVRDKRNSDIIMTFWSNFAKSSNPTEGSIYAIRWEPFTPEDPGILIIDRTFNMSDTTHLNYKSFEFWNRYYPKVIDIATQCCNASSIYDHAETISRSYLLLPVMLLLLLILRF